MPERIGQQLGNYTLLQLLGQGGFADVYLAEHVYLKSQAAIKILQTRLSDSGDIDSFLREAQTIARLSHPNIIRVLDFGMAQDTPYLVMDYAPNGTLRARHPRSARVPLPTLLPYVRQISDALQYAHDEHIIHRDIKPENMLLGRRNEVLLSDFGIALVAQSSRYQGTQDVIGTVGYMSPEQIQGKPRPASDQYSLAIVVYEWLSGERPFHGSFTELCTQQIFAPPPPLTEKLAHFSPAIEQVVMKALHKDPKQRYESIHLFARAFEEASQLALQNPQTAQTLLEPPTPPPTPLQQDYATLFLPDAQPSPTSQPSPMDRPSLSLQKPDLPLASDQRPAPSEIPASFSPTSFTFHSSETAANTRPEHFPTTLQSQTTPSQTPSSRPTPTPHSFTPEKKFLPAQPPRSPQNPSSTPPPSFPTPNARGQFSQTPLAPQSFSAQTQSSTPPSSPMPQPQTQFSYPAQAMPPSQSPAPLASPRNNAFASLEQGTTPPPTRPVSRPSSTTPVRPAERESAEDWWGPLAKIKWRLLATLIGIILLCLLHNFRPFVPYLLNRHIPLLLVVPLFFGAAFGPWVGLAVGLGGLFAGDLLYGDDGIHIALFGNLFFIQRHILYSWWIPCATYALAGFTPGLTMLGKRRYPSLSSVIRAMLLTLIFFAAALAFLVYSANDLRAFFPISLVLLANLVIALVLLIIYSIIIRLIDPAS